MGWNWHGSPNFLKKKISESGIHIYWKTLDRFLLNFKRIFEMTIKILEKCMFRNGCYPTSIFVIKTKNQAINQSLVTIISQSTGLFELMGVGEYLLFRQY